MLTRIHVNQHIIKANRTRGENNPPLTVKTYKDNRKAYTATIIGNDGMPVASVVYQPDNPLSCGATVWVETTNPVIVEDWRPAPPQVEGQEALF